MSNNKLSEVEIQIFARLTMFEFLFEVMLAQGFATQPKTEGEAFAKSFRDLMKSSFVSPESDPDYLDQTMDMLKLSGDLADRLLDKALRRADAIRGE